MIRVASLLRGFGSFPLGGSGSLSLSVVDDADNTGATATITGATGTVTIYAASWSGGFTSPSFASVGSRSGDGTVSLALAAGYWWVYAATSNYITPVVGVLVTTGNDAMWYRILVAVTERIQALSLSGLDSDNVIMQKFPFNKKSNQSLADRLTTGIFVNPTRETLTPKTNRTDDYGYGVQVTYFTVSNRDLTSNLNRTLQWRDTLWKAHIFQYLPGFTEGFNCTPEPGPVYDAGAFAENMDAGSLVLRFFSREARGI